MAVSAARWRLASERDIPRFNKSCNSAFNSDSLMAAALSSWLKSTLKRGSASHVCPAPAAAGTGTAYRNAAPLFLDGSVAMHMSGSWMIGNYAENITNFEWRAVPAPCGPGTGHTRRPARACLGHLGGGHDPGTAR